MLYMFTYPSDLTDIKMQPYLVTFIFRHITLKIALTLFRLFYLKNRHSFTPSLSFLFLPEQIIFLKLVWCLPNMSYTLLRIYEFISNGLQRLCMDKTVQPFATVFTQQVCLRLCQHIEVEFIHSDCSVTGFFDLTMVYLFILLFRGNLVVSTIFSLETVLQ